MATRVWSHYPRMGIETDHGRGGAHEKRQQERHHSSLALIVVSLGFGMVIPIFPFYIEHLGGGGKELGCSLRLAALTELIFGPVWAACPTGSVASRS